MEGKNLSIDDEKEFQEHDEVEHEVDWSVYGDHEQAATSLEGKDILALFLASLQTIFLPLVLLGIFLFVIGILFGILL
ncbi:MAG: hypothetical protein ACFFDV_01010 [Candidatus Thorarchaeota archaeon]